MPERVVTPDIMFKRRSLQMTDRNFKKQVASDLHNYTYGITSDPLTQFAIVFSALVCAELDSRLFESTAKLTLTISICPFTDP